MDIPDALAWLGRLPLLTAPPTELQQAALGAEAEQSTTQRRQSRATGTMKGHQQQPHSSPLLLPPNKRRCTALAAAVPALVFCSILLPLVFLLGLHRPGVYAASSRASDLFAFLAYPTNRVALSFLEAMNRRSALRSSPLISTVR